MRKMYFPYYIPYLLVAGLPTFFQYHCAVDLLQFGSRGSSCAEDTAGVPRATGKWDGTQGHRRLVARTAAGTRWTFSSVPPEGRPRPALHQTRGRGLDGDALSRWGGWKVVPPVTPSRFSVLWGHLCSPHETAHTRSMGTATQTKKYLHLLPQLGAGRIAATIRSTLCSFHGSCGGLRTRKWEFTGIEKVISDHWLSLGEGGTDSSFSFLLLPILYFTQTLPKRPKRD